MRAVLDTNIIVSALLAPFGNEARLLGVVQNDKLTPCISREILAEYAGVLARPKFSFAKSEIAGLIGLMEAKGLMVDPPRITAASPDPKDNDFIACAIAANADFLVTGNRRHFPLQSCGQTRVVSAGELLEILNTPQSP